MSTTRRPTTAISAWLAMGSRHLRLARGRSASCRCTRSSRGCERARAAVRQGAVRRRFGRPDRPNAVGRTRRRGPRASGPSRRRVVDRRRQHSASATGCMAGKRLVPHSVAAEDRPALMQRADPSPRSRVGPFRAGTTRSAITGELSAHRHGAGRVRSKDVSRRSDRLSRLAQGAASGVASRAPSIWSRYCHHFWPWSRCV